MYAGYLVIETNTAYPGVVRILETASLPPEDRRGHRHGEGPQVRYAGHFDDLSAGRMHAHGALSRRLLDLEEGLYRCDVVDAVAAVEASVPTHRTAYLDPELAQNPRFAEITATRRSRHLLADLVWRAIGIAALLFLVTKVLFGF